MRCPVCFENEALFDGPSRFLSKSKCKHALCTNCWRKLQQPKCPLCREDIQKWLCDKKYKTCNTLINETDCEGDCNKTMCSICYDRHITKCKYIFMYDIKNGVVSDNVKLLIKSHSHLCDFSKLSLSI